MLILTRRTSESIRIGDDIEIAVLGVKGQQVRIGISAPKSVSVHREEVYTRINGCKSAEIGVKSGGDCEATPIAVAV